jgi:XTP/dITP diphosphohydrolase
MTEGSAPAIVLASNNKGKLREINQLVENCPFTITPQSAFRVSEIEETGLSFVENALLKARHASQASGHPAIADDSGLEVDVLDGAPGIYSARYAGIDASDSENVNKLLHHLRDIPEARRSARFQCLMVYMSHGADPTPLICQGTWEGRILLRPCGQNGFGYDPIFYVPDYGCSAAELAPEIKNTISHRGQALRQLIALLDCATPTKT